MNRKMLSKQINNNYNLHFSVYDQSGLLEFLLKNVSGKSRNNIKSFLTRGAVTVDSIVVTKYDYDLQPGQIVCVDMKKHSTCINGLWPDIIYEDNDFIVINKPIGLVTVSTGHQGEFTAHKMMNCYIKNTDINNNAYVVHRLDRDTSGVLLFSKKEDLKNALQADWSSLITIREYIAIVEGKLNEKSGEIHSWLKQTKTLLVYSSNKRGDGLEAITKYTVMKENEKYTMLDIHLETGRKNQIRVHMKDIGHSIIGDKKYGAEMDPIRRLGLHASKLELIHPLSGKVFCFEAPVPESFEMLFMENN